MSRVLILVKLKLLHYIKFNMGLNYRLWQNIEIKPDYMKTYDSHKNQAKI